MNLHVAKFNAATGSKAEVSVRTGANIRYLSADIDFYALDPSWDHAEAATPQSAALETRRLSLPTASGI